MKYTAPHSLPIIEPSKDNIKDPASVSALADGVNLLSTTTNTAISLEGGRAETAAITAADADATAKANIAESAAIDVAATDATSKAEAAKSDAIEAASLDATSKADAAAWYKGELPANTDSNTFDGVGRYYVLLEEDLATISNLPDEAWMGWGEFSKNTNGSMKEQTWTNYGTNRSWRRTTASTTAATFTVWTEIASVATANAAADAARDLAISDAAADATAKADNAEVAAKVEAESNLGALEDELFAEKLSTFSPSAVWRGTWDALGSYAPGDVVAHDGETWLSAKATAPSTRTNYITNPRFRENLDGWAMSNRVEYTTDKTGPAYTLQVTPAKAFSYRNTVIVETRDRPATADQIWSGGFHITVAEDQPTVTLMARLTATDSTGADTLLFGDLTESIPGVTKRRVSVTATMPPDTVKVSMRLVAGDVIAVGTSFGISLAMLEKAATLGYYFDGGSATTTDSWTGEEDNSTSTRTTPSVEPGTGSVWASISAQIEQATANSPTRTNPDEKFVPEGGPVKAETYPTYMDRNDRTTMINHLSTTLRVTKDEGETWQAVHVFPDERVRSGIIMDNGEVLVSVMGNAADAAHRIILSKGFPDDPAAATWTEVMVGSPSTAKPSQAFSWSHHKNVVMVSDYGPKLGQSGVTDNARYAYASRDYGKTWKTVFDLNTDHPELVSTDGVHIHGSLYDPYWDRLWITHGDDTQGILYSDDWGKTWEVAVYHDVTGEDQVVGMYALPKCILFASDGSPNGVRRINRSEGKHKGRYDLDTGYLHDDSPNLEILCQSVWKANRPGDDAPVVFEFVSAPGDGKRFAVTTVDGYTFNKIWEDDQITRGNSSGRAFGPTASGQLLMYVVDGRFTEGGRTIWRGPMPAAY